MLIGMTLALCAVNVIGAVILFGVATARRDQQTSSFLPLAFWTTAVVVGLPSSLCTLVATHHLVQGRDLGLAVGYLASFGLFAIAVWSASRGPR